MIVETDALERGRSCYGQRKWAEAFDTFLRAERHEPLDRDDLARLVWSAALCGRDDAFLGGLERLHQAHIDAEEYAPAARAAFWLGFRLLALGSSGGATGWFARAQRLVERAGNECAERGYLLLPTIYRQLDAADYATAHDVANEAAELGERANDVDLVALARNLQGRALLRQGRVQSGLALLDEIMVAVMSGELSPLVTGIVYCNVIATCQDIYALDRASEWTSALARWCEEQPELVTFTGICLVHRSQILQLEGSWPAAIEQVDRVCEGTHRDADPEVFGDAWYQRAELLRLRGHFVEAEEAYRLASQNGREPQPGLALLRLAQSRKAAAVSAMQRILSTTSVAWQRARLLPAFVEVMLAAGELDEARVACSELEEIAAAFGTDVLAAMAAHARGALLVADGDHRAAIEPLRHAFRVWHKVGAPYIAARIRVLLARACCVLGDNDGAELELDAARRVFEQLGATPDLAALDAPTENAARERDHGLSRREVEVLRLVARGKTNKVIASELCLSERTVDRHVANVFMKIGVSSRAAATAFAYENDLV